MKTALRSVALAFLVLAAALAVDVKSLQRSEGYVSDFAHVLDPAARQDLERYCARVEQATTAQIALVTLDTIGDEPIEDFANTLFRQWGVGKKGEDNGVLLLLVINDRRSRLEVGRGLEPYITDGTAGALLRQMRPALREGQYAAALGTAAQMLGDRIAQAKGVTIDESYRPRQRVRQQPVGGQVPWPVLLGGMFLLLWLFGMGGRRGGGGGGLIPGLILGSMLNRSSYGGYGRGGFGGYDSGDSFGGFGGGDSGGGGASSNW